MYANCQGVSLSANDSGEVCADEVTTTRGRRVVRRGRQIGSQSTCGDGAPGHDALEPAQRSNIAPDPDTAPTNFAVRSSRGFLKICCGAPTSMIDPWSMTTIRSATCAAKCIS